MSESVLEQEEIDKLSILVEEATRETTGSPKRFIEPARGTLGRAKTRRHHIVFGRRGSGKTSMLRKAEADLSIARRPVAFIDLETFKAHRYPDVLLSVLIEVLGSFERWLETAGTYPATKTSFWQRIFGRKPERPPLNKKKVAALRKELVENVDELRELLHATDGAEIGVVRKEGGQAKASVKAGFGARVKGFEGKYEAADEVLSEASSEYTETIARSKVDFLYRKIIDYQKIAEQLALIAAGDAFVFLDDLYHLQRDDQPQVLDYLHRIAKGRSLWLKVGTIRHRTQWYKHGQPPVGLKLGDDADEIDLDITLEKYELAKKFLFKVLDGLVVEAGLKSHTAFLSRGGIDRLVLASGGVVRDFLTIFRRSIDVKRERGVNHRGEKIGAEDVNSAAGEHDTSKRDELKRDTHGEREQLEKALARLRDFCVEKQANCFLFERDVESPATRLIGELIDLRFVHLASSRVTARGRKGKLYSCFLLDISQYTGERMRREMRLVEFWTREGLDTIRRGKFVFDAEEEFRSVVGAQ